MRDFLAQQNLYFLGILPNFMCSICYWICSKSGAVSCGLLGFSKVAHRLSVRKSEILQVAYAQLENNRKKQVKLDSTVIQT